MIDARFHTRVVPSLPSARRAAMCTAPVAFVVLAACACGGEITQGPDAATNDAGAAADAGPPMRADDASVSDATVDGGGPTECGAGMHRSEDGVCIACPSGTYNGGDAEECVAWTECAPEQTEDRAGTATRDRTCYGWIRQFGGGAGESALSLTVDGAGDVFVVGNTEGALPGQTAAGGRDAFVRRYRADGTELWTRQFGTSGSDSAYSVALDHMGNVVVGGFVHGALAGQTHAGAFDAFVRKYDADGTELWTRQFGSAYTYYAFSVAADGAGNVFVVGEGLIGGDAGEAYVRKYDPEGTEVWTRRFGSSAGGVRPLSAAVGSAGDVFVGGWTGIALPGQTSLGERDAFVRKYDADGTESWTRQFGTSGGDWAFAVALDGADNVFVGGWTDGALPGQTLAGDQDVFVRKYDADGTELWTRQFGTSSRDQGMSLAVDGGGSVLVGGNTEGALPEQSLAGGDDAFVRSYDADGTELWTHQFGTGSDDFVHSLATDGDGHVFIAGSTRGSLPGQTNAGEEDAFVRAMLP